MNSQISIIGTGWLGLPLAQDLYAKGYTVKCTTTTQKKLEQLKKFHLQPYVLELTEQEVRGKIIEFLAGSETLLINIPPGLRKNPESDFVQKIRNLLPYLEKSKVKHLFFISSTSVFKDTPHFPVITQKKSPNATSNTAKQLIAVEQILTALKGIRTTIIRFGGLYDKRRHPATMIAKKGVISNPLAPVNLIHREDCVGIILRLMQLKEKGDFIINAAHPNHPTKKAYYQQVSMEMGLPIPIAEENEISKGKVIDSSYLKEKLNYSFRKGL